MYKGNQDTMTDPLKKLIADVNRERVEVCQFRAKIPQPWALSTTAILAWIILFVFSRAVVWQFSRLAVSLASIP